MLESKIGLCSVGNRETFQGLGLKVGVGGEGARFQMTHLGSCGEIRVRGWVGGMQAWKQDLEKAGDGN